MSKLSVRDYSQIALVAAIYVVLTAAPPLNAISYGAYQFRVAEMLNFLAFYNRKYIIGVTLGCMIANYFMYGPIDVFVGGGSTLVFLSLGVYFFDKFKKTYWFGGRVNKAFFLFAIFFSLSMVTIAAELTYLYQAPFFLTWFTTGVGEFASLLVGALVMDKLGKRMDLTK